MLAALLALRGGEEEWQESQKLIETPGVKASAERTAACRPPCWCSRGGKENLLKARRILENLVADPR